MAKKDKQDFDPKPLKRGDQVKPDGGEYKPTKEDERALAALVNSNGGGEGGGEGGGWETNATSYAPPQEPPAQSTPSERGTPGEPSADADGGGGNPEKQRRTHKPKRQNKIKTLPQIYQDLADKKRARREERAGRDSGGGGGGGGGVSKEYIDQKFDELFKRLEVLPTDIYNELVNRSQ